MHNPAHGLFVNTNVPKRKSSSITSTPSTGIIATRPAMDEGLGDEVIRARRKQYFRFQYEMLIYGCSNNWFVDYFYIVVCFRAYSFSTIGGPGDIAWIDWGIGQYTIT